MGTERLAQREECGLGFLKFEPGAERGQCAGARRDCPTPRRDKSPLSFDSVYFGESSSRSKETAVNMETRAESFKQSSVN